MRKCRKNSDTTTPTAKTPNTITNMTAQDHYSLRWNNHQNHILRAFDTLLQTKALVDVTLVCAETSIRAHKMVLSACSPFFQRVFSETPCKHPVIVLKDFRGWVVQAIVDFMYRGEISVPQERLQTLIQAGESLQVRGLVENTSSIPGNTPTPAASPDDFGIMNTTAAMLSSELSRCSNFDDDDTPPTMVSSTSKLLLPSQIFSDASSSRDPHRDIRDSDMCTSPMPRRKQARPRRRSGECAPQDLSKPSSPIPDDVIEVKSDNDKSEKEQKPQIIEKDQKLEDQVQDNDHQINHKDQLEQQQQEDEEDQQQDNEEIDRPPSSMDCEDNIEESQNDIDSGILDNCEGPEDLCTKKDNDESLNNEQILSSSNKTNNNNNNSSSSNSNLNVNKNNNNNDNDNIDNNNDEDLCDDSNSMNNNNNTRVLLSLKDFRHISKSPRSLRSPNLFQPHHLNLRPASADDTQLMKDELIEGRLDNDSPFPMDQLDLSMAAAAAAAAAHHHHQQQQQHHPTHMSANNMIPMSSAHGHDRLEDVQNRLNKDFAASSPMSLPPHFNPPDGPPHPPSPLPFPGMSSALALTSQNMFGFDSALGLFPPGIDPGKLYNPLMEMSDPRGLPNEHPPFLKKKSKYLPRPKGQHSAPRGGPPRSWTNAELTEALQHVWNKKMTTSQASRIFGIPYNSLLMYVRGKYGKSLKLEQLRKDCISGPPIELLTMGLNNGNNSNSSKNNNNNNSGINENRTKELKDHHHHHHHHPLHHHHDGSMQRSSSSEPDLLSSPNPLFNPFPPGFYPDFPGGFPGLPLSMLNLLPPERHHSHHQQSSSSSASLHHHHSALNMNMNIDEDCKSDRSKQSSLEDEFPQPLALHNNTNRDDRRELLQQNGQD